MSYQVLARKWRPQTFEEVVGQEHITRTLQNAITAGRLAHAFLFSGPRGVGKTTTARILAKALNCKNGPTPAPCGVCDPCKETAAGVSVDVIEIDGASNRGIEHIRELREAVQYAPAGGSHKVYVIDEVHMLTNEAFNALLKTLEEPPPHVIFIFATTEPQKIPATIHSRCQRYSFKRITLHDLTTKLREITNAEGIEISSEGLGMIARAAEGSMRDSQSLLDQAVSYSGTTVADQDLQVLLGSVTQGALIRFADELLNKNSSALLKQVDTLLEEGQDIRQFLSGAVEHVRNLLVAKIASDPGKIIELPAADIEAIQQQSERSEAPILLMLFDSLSKTLDEIRWSSHQRFTLEVGLIKACNISALKPINEMLERLSALEERCATNPDSTSPEETLRERPATYTTSAEKDSSKQKAKTSDEPADTWKKLLMLLKDQKPSLASALAHSRLVAADAEEIVIGVAGSGFQLDLAGKRENRSVIEQAASALLNRNVQVRFQHLGEMETSSGTTGATKRKKAGQDDPIVQDALRIFGGHMIEPDHPDQ